jgi:uroporphyrinogen III methyltransferase/synthase
VLQNVGIWQMNPNVGKVYLVGAGPGDPGLLTLRGAECLRNADVVLYDYLASPQLLEWTREDAELVCLGRHGHGRLMSQTEINEAMIRHARTGRCVVRLKGGDPMVFARGGEELAALESAGISYEIVPGITAAQAASSHAGVPLTGRDQASCVAFVAGQESTEKDPSTPPLDYAALARFPGTLVFYMGVTTAPVWSRALIEHGRRPGTPVAIVRKCSLPEQEVVFTTLAEVADVLLTRKLRPPAVIIVGETARDRAVANWFTNRPLLGRTVLVTRPIHQADGLAELLRNLGATVMLQPAIEIGPPRDWALVDAALDGLTEFDWVVFASANGVEFFMRRLIERGRDARSLANTRIAAIGPATAEALVDHHLLSDLQPAEYRAEALAESLAPQIAGKRVLLARASRGREVLAEMLAAAGATVEQIVVYESRDIEAPDLGVTAALAAGQIHWTTVTSSAIARSLVKLFGDSLCRTRLAAISSLTAQALADLGYPPGVVAQTYTGEGIVSAILAAESDKA